MPIYEVLLLVCGFILAVMIVGVGFAVHMNVMVARNNQCQLETKAIVAEHHEKMTEHAAQMEARLQAMREFQQNPNLVHKVAVEQDPDNPLQVTAVQRRADDPGHR